MKKKPIIGLFLSLLGIGVTTTSCEDMLTPEMNIYAENFTGRDTVNFYYGILANVQDLVENNVILADLRSDLVDTTSYVSDSVAAIANFEQTPDGDNGLLKRAAYYKVINQCNFYLAKCDTMLQKNGNYYMRREFAQVDMVRAWTYMQLVQTYGTVPFITVPVDNAGTGWEKNPAEGYVSPDNLLSKLRAAGLDRSYTWSKTLGTPNYGNENNGLYEFSQTFLVFDPDIVMGDLYLLGATTQNDYLTAAQYYYNYLYEAASKSCYPSSSNSLSLSRHVRGGNIDFNWGTSENWASFKDQGSAPSSGSSDIVTCVMSAANKIHGTVLTRTASIYGFDPASSSSTSSSTSSDGTESYSTSGSISIEADYKARQIGPSQRYRNLVSSQIVRYPSSTTSSEDTYDDIEYPQGVGDGRINGTISKVRTTIGDIDFVQKRVANNSSADRAVSTTSFKFNYTIPLYRNRQIYLRFAEAINRAGFPRFAFAVLRDGLNANNIPDVRQDSVSADNKIVPYAADVAEGCFYLDVNELRRAKNYAFLDFSDSRWDNVVGIHELGCGKSADVDSLFSYDNIVAQRIAEEAARVSGTAVSEKTIAKLRASLKDEEVNPDQESGEEGEDTEEPAVDPSPADDPVIPDNIGEQINAVETLIADEYALETAFEGFRFFDLTRIARHKNNDTWNFASGDYGTTWFAWTIARRSVKAAPYANLSEYNHSLYSRLLSIDNWYLQSPQY